MLLSCWWNFCLLVSVPRNMKDCWKKLKGTEHIFHPWISYKPLHPFQIPNSWQIAPFIQNWLKSLKFQLKIQLPRKLREFLSAVCQTPAQLIPFFPFFILENWVNGILWKFKRVIFKVTTQAYLVKLSSRGCFALYSKFYNAFELNFWVNYTPFSW